MTALSARTARRTGPGTAEYRPAARRRRNRHDDPVAVDLFSGFGGLTEGIERAGFTTILAANHNRYKVEVHEANYRHVDHWIADLVDPDSGDYHSAEDLPEGDLLVAGVSCVNHSPANAQKAYGEGLSLFTLPDPEWEERVTRSERDRATATCVLQYARKNRPRMILVECTTELASWGPALPGRRKVGDGSTYRWWLAEFAKLGYRHRVLYLNAMFFGVPQSRDRGFWVFWDQSMSAPDLDHRPPTWCARCDRTVEAVWTWRTGLPPTGSVRYGKQYDYRCPSCHREVHPPSAVSLAALDLTDLGTRIGDKPIKKFYRKGEYIGSGPPAPATMARAERCRQRFAQFPAVIMPAKAVWGVERHPWQPLATQTSQQEATLISTGVLMGAAGNTFEWPGSDCRSRGVDQPLWAQTATNGVGLLTPPVAVANYQGAPRSVADPLPTQLGSETLALVSAGVVPFRQNTVPTSHAQAMPTVTADQIPGLLSTAGLVGGWYKQNGSTGDETAPHPLTDALGTLTSRDTTGLLLAQWRAALAEVALDDCYFRMLLPHEIGRGCGFDVDFPGYGHRGTFIVWGTPSDQVDGFGNAVPPQVGEWIGLRLRAALHGDVAA